MSLPLDPVTLQYFVAVCEEGSMARAAARSSLVASALSKRLAALEAQVGVPLLLRQRRGVQPTPAGEALLARAREVLAALDQMRAELGAFGQGVQGSVRVLASPSALAEHLPDDIASFMGEHPRLHVRLEERVSPDIVRCLHQGTADLGVLWDLADLSGLQVRPYRVDRLCVAIAPGHRLAPPEHASWRFADVLDELTISMAPGGLMDLLLQRQSALLGRALTRRIQVSSMEAACRIAAAGLGLALLPRQAAQHHADTGRLRLVPLDDDWALRQLVVASRPEPLCGASARLLAGHLAQVANGIQRAQGLS